MSIRVVLAEDSLLAREGLQRLLEALPDIEVVAVVEDAPALLDAVAEHAPGVVVTDIRMPPTGTDEGIRVAGRLRSSHPDVGVVVLSQHLEPEYALALFAQGSAGRAYLLKERLSRPRELAAAITEVAGGGSVVDSRVVDTLIASRSGQPRSPLDRLTPREREVLAKVAQGGTNDSIAAALQVTSRAVEKHINAIFSKLELTEDAEVHRRVTAALMFLAATGGAPSR